MNASGISSLKTLTEEEISCVSGAGIPGLHQPARPMDKWGNTTTMEDYMDRQLKAAQTGDARWVFGGTSPSGFPEPEHLG